MVMRWLRRCESQVPKRTTKLAIYRHTCNPFQQYFTVIIPSQCRCSKYKEREAVGLALLTIECIAIADYSIHHW